MNIWKLLKWGMLLVVCIVVKSVDALDIPQYELEYGGKIYTTEGLASSRGADHHAYLSLITELSSIVIKGNRALAMQTINSKMNFNARESSAFLALAIQSYADLRESNHSVTSYLLCDIAHIELDAKRSSNLLDTLDDLMDANLQKQFQAMKANVQTSDLNNLELWLSDRSHDSKSITHERLSSAGDFAMNQIIESNCNQLALNVIET